MRPYESDIYKPNCKLNHGHQTEIISFDIEYITLISYIINAVEGSLNISEATPFTLFYLLNPILQSNLRLRVPFCIFFDGLFGKNSHCVVVYYFIMQIYTKCFIFQNIVSFFET